MDKVILFAQQGSGTNMFRSLVNSHPNVTILGEIFQDTHQDTLKEMVDLYEENLQRADSRVKGADIKYNQTNIEFMGWAKDNDIKIIHLIRDRARTFVSNLDAAIDEQFSIEDIKNYRDNVEQRIELVRNFFEENYLELFYEELTLGREIEQLRQEKSYKVCDFLGVDRKILELSNIHCTQKRIKKRF